MERKLEKLELDIGRQGGGETGKDALCWERREDHVALVILDEQFYRGFVSSLGLTLLGDLLLTF